MSHSEIFRMSMTESGLDAAVEYAAQFSFRKIPNLAENPKLMAAWKEKARQLANGKHTCIHLDAHEGAFRTRYRTEIRASEQFGFEVWQTSTEAGSSPSIWYAMDGQQAVQAFASQAKKITSMRDQLVAQFTVRPIYLLEKHYGDTSDREIYEEVLKLRGLARVLAAHYGINDPYDGI